MVLGLCLLLALSSCGGEEGASLIGRWANESAGESIEFRPDGSVTISSGDSAMELTYDIEGDTIRLSQEGSGETQELRYSLDGDTLTLSSGGKSMKYDRTE